MGNILNMPCEMDLISQSDRVSTSLLGLVLTVSTTLLLLVGLGRGGAKVGGENVSAPRPTRTALLVPYLSLCGPLFFC